MSAEANLAGMFPPNGSEVFNPDLKWQPLPVHTVPADEERVGHHTEVLFPLFSPQFCDTLKFGPDLSLAMKSYLLSNSISKCLCMLKICFHGYMTCLQCVRFFFSFQLLSFPLDDCPRYTQLMNETEKTDFFLNMTETYKVSPPCKNSFITADHMFMDWKAIRCFYSNYENV